MEVDVLTNDTDPVGDTLRVVRLADLDGEPTNDPEDMGGDVQIVEDRIHATPGVGAEAPGGIPRSAVAGPWSPSVADVGRSALHDDALAQLVPPVGCARPRP